MASNVVARITTTSNTTGITKTQAAFKRLAADAKSVDKAVGAVQLQRFAKGAAMTAAAMAVLTPAAASAASAIMTVGVAAAGVGVLALPALGAVLAGLDGIKAAAKTIEPQFVAFKAAMSESFSGMAVGFGSLASMLASITPQMQGLGMSITGVFNMLGEALNRNAAGIGVIADKAAALFDRLAPYIDGLVDKFVKFGTSIQLDGIFSVFENLWSLLGPLVTLFTSLAGAAGPFGNVMTTLGQIITAITPALTQVVAEVGPQLALAFSAASPAIITLVGAFAELLAVVAPLLPPIMRLVSDVLEPLAPILPALVAQIVAVVAVLKIWTMVQTALNIVLMANPIGLLIAAIVALIAGIIWLATQTTFFQDTWQIMCDAVSAAWNFIWNAIKAVATFVLNAILAYIGFWVAIITAIWNGLKAAAAAVWNGIQAVVQAVANVIGSAITAAVNIVIGIFNTVKSVASGVWNAITGFIEGVGNAIQSVISWVQDLIGMMGKAADIVGSLNPFSAAAGVGVAYMAPIPFGGPGSPLPAGVLHLGRNYPSLAGLGALGGGVAAVQNIDARTIVQVDGSGIADPQQVAHAVAGSVGRNSRTRGDDFAVRFGSGRRA